MNLYYEICRYLYPFMDTPMPINSILIKYGNDLQVNEMMRMINQMYISNYTRIDHNDYSHIKSIKDIPEIKLSLTNPGREHWEEIAHFHPSMEV